jgi:DNA-binding HxlR family transcriptional regulator
MLAYALDSVGERWTLLIIRDLLLGPRGFGELQASLKGIGGSLLSKRLKALEEDGLIAGEGPEGGRALYRLTDLGERLRPAVRAMMRWSVRFTKATVDNPQTRQKMFDEVFRPDSVALGLEMYADFQRDPALSYVARLIVDGRPYTLYYMNGEMTVKRGADAPAIATIETDSETALAALKREIDAAEALARMKPAGDARVIDHVMRCMASKRPEKKPGEEAA